MTSAIRQSLFLGALAGAMLLPGVCPAQDCLAPGCAAACCCGCDALWYPSVASPAGGATLTIWVPRETEVYINGQRTESTGSKRRYCFTNLQADPQTGEPLSYTCSVRADVSCARTEGDTSRPENPTVSVKERRKLSLSRELLVRAGDDIRLTFSPDVVTLSELTATRDPLTGLWQPYATGKVSVVMIDDLVRESEARVSRSQQQPPSPRPAEWSGQPVTLPSSSSQ